MQNMAENNRFIDFFTLRGYRCHQKDASKELFKKDTLMPRIFGNIEKQLFPSLQETLEVSDHADFCVE